MGERYIAFDVETPNRANDRISAIGIAVMEEGVLSKQFYSLVNPETQFESFHIQLTGITPEMVASAPTFPQLWREISNLMDSGVLIAHNAPFDMGVLAKCLRAYQIPWKEIAVYACTCVMGRACYPALSNHKLNTLCQYRQVSLDHHNAGSDSRACAMLLQDYVQQGLQIEPFLRAYDVQRRRTLPRSFGLPGMDLVGGK